MLTLVVLYAQKVLVLGLKQCGFTDLGLPGTL